MKRISIVLLAGMVFNNAAKFGWTEELPPPLAITPESSVDTRPILIKLVISEEQNGKREILSRPGMRTLSGVPGTVHVGQTGKGNHISGITAEIVAVPEAELFPSPAEVNPVAARTPCAGTSGLRAIPIKLRVSVTKLQDGQTESKLLAQLRVWDGEPSTIKAGPLEVQLTASVVEPESIKSADNDLSREALRLLRVLQKRISFEFNETPLRDVIRELAKCAEVNVVIDPRSLDDEGLTVDAKVTASVRGLRFSTALDQILGPLGLDYVAADEVIKITSRTCARGEPVTVTYPVADLIARLEHGQLKADTDAEQNLVEQIAETLSPESWDRKGGRGSIRVFQPSHSLVIRQVADVHDEIAELLNKLRSSRKRGVITGVGQDESATATKSSDIPLSESVSNPPD